MQRTRTFLRTLFVCAIVVAILVLPAVAQAESPQQHTGPGSRPTPEAVRPDAGWPFGTQGYTCARSRVQECVNLGHLPALCRVGCWDMSEGIVPTPQPTPDMTRLHQCRWTPSTPWCYGV